MEERIFEITSGKAVLSDPCYELGTWCQGIVDNVKNGKWVAILEQSDRELMTSGDLLPFNGGVDSGQFGHFDYANYRKDETAIDLPKVWEDEWESQEGDKFYRACCFQTLEKEDRFGVLPFGCVSSSGYGDGSYPTYGIKDDNGEYIGFMTIFIGDDEDE